jgi:hypothetical protein
MYLGMNLGLVPLLNRHSEHCYDETNNNGNHAGNRNAAFTLSILMLMCLVLREFNVLDISNGAQNRNKKDLKTISFDISGAPVNRRKGYPVTLNQSR